MLTKERGIYKACLYGGAKSKLRSLCAQWHYGIVYIYENPEKKQNKISDFDVKNYHVSFSENLFKSYAASMAAEIAIKTECAGDLTAFWPLFNSLFDGMELSDETQSRVGFLRFLWRFIQVMGIMPDTTTCPHCEQSLINENQNLEISLLKNELYYYNVNENNFLCSDCADAHVNQTLLPVKNGALYYLWAVSNLDAKDARRFPLDQEGFLQIRKIVYEMTKLACNTRLNTLETGMGIL